MYPEYTESPEYPEYPKSPEYTEYPKSPEYPEYPEYPVNLVKVLVPTRLASCRIGLVGQ